MCYSRLLHIRENFPVVYIQTRHFSKIVENIPACRKLIMNLEAKK